MFSSLCKSLPEVILVITDITGIINPVTEVIYIYISIYTYHGLDPFMTVNGHNRRAEEKLGKTEKQLMKTDEKTNELMKQVYIEKLMNTD